MTKKTRDYRFNAGEVEFRRFAYRHKSKPDLFGLLEAVDSRDARRHLGSQFFIRQVWLTVEDDHAQADSRERRREIVDTVIRRDVPATIRHGQ